MASLQVRDLPDHLYSRLTREAQLMRRSLSQQAIVVLERGLEMHADPQERRRRLLSDIAALELPPEVANAPDPAVLIRADRDSR